MGAIIIPKRPLPELDRPIVFLAGPIRGASDWRSRAIECLFELDIDDKIIIASPSTRVKEELQKFIISGDGLTFLHNRAWERYVMDIAGKQKGSILFWLCEEIEHNCQKPFGSMTRVEFGEWITHKKYNESVSICVGTDSAFPDIRPMLYDLSEISTMKVSYTLEETCEEAFRLANL